MLASTWSSPYSSRAAWRWWVAGWLAPQKQQHGHPPYVRAKGWIVLASTRSRPSLSSSRAAWRLSLAGRQVGCLLDGDQKLTHRRHCVQHLDLQQGQHQGLIR